MLAEVLLASWRPLFFYGLSDETATDGPTALANLPLQTSAERARSVQDPLPGFTHTYEANVGVLVGTLASETSNHL
jgi:hypothetical protein